MMPYLQFHPLYQERVWGGRSLAQAFGRVLPGTGPVGESWEISDRPEAQSVVVAGPLAGQTLGGLLAARGGKLMGPGWTAGRRFPLLVKWLDCRERLSLQVHPPAAVAAELGGEPKTENWYFAQTAPGAGVLAGLQSGVGADAFAQALQQGTAEECMRRWPVRAGDSLLIRSGVMHAIDAGCLILEIQQNSDTTYRVHDWGRTGLDGRPRALHVPQALASLRAARAGEMRLVPADGADRTVLAECAEFRIARHRLPAGGSLAFAAGEQPRLLSVVAGGLRDAAGVILPAGENIFLPYAGASRFAAPEGATVLVTDRFYLPPA